MNVRNFKLNKIMCLLLLLFTSTFAQRPKTTFTASAYYTSGNYSTNNSSESFSFYGIVDIKKLDKIIFGYDNLTIQIPDSNWIYEQNFFVISGIKNLYPFYLKFDYAYTSGQYAEKYRGRYFYGSITDATHIINASLLYNWNLFFFGLGGSYSIGTGYYDLNTTYIEGKITWHPSNYFNINLMPAYTTTDDNRSSFSLGAEIFYAPASFINFSIRGFVGDRVVYYNSDYQTIYNQIETQTKAFGIIIRLLADKPFNIIAAYQSRDFTNYTINYLTGGISYRF